MIKRFLDGKTNIINIFFTVFPIATLIWLVLFMHQTVESGSMENTIMTGQHVWTYRFAYAYGSPQRGDIISFKFDRYTFVKRIIGLPGDTVEIHDGKVYINGEELEEDYVKGTTYSNTESFEVPKHSYFVLGDNRENSYDSREWDDPYVKAGNIYGKVTIY